MNPRSIFLFSFLFSISILFIFTSCAGPLEKLYIAKCSNCHGEDGTGKKANIDFTRHKFSLERIKKSILHGKGEMANIPGIEEPELTQIANYVSRLYKDK